MQPINFPIIFLFFIPHEKYQLSLELHTIVTPCSCPYLAEMEEFGECNLAAIYLTEQQKGKGNTQPSTPVITTLSISICHPHRLLVIKFISICRHIV